ncbi:ATP-binding protein [Streptomyces sp. NBC_01017]|uniref:ATP-binding protein n=1 Tax=Streptomyces sp. NBC_01017 TaxID=2903721 RepID=UPI003868EB6D|nr:ATP-binding protein [Streptomyces sp. NBC_01017]WSV35144.1 ATP-binding protein [Streptomyces sp. NBC_01017]
MTTLTKQIHIASVGRPAYSQTFPCEPSTAEIGRQLLRDVLGIWRLDSLVDHALLIVTELIANAARHTPCHKIRLIVELPSPTRLRVGVLDRAPTRLPAFSRTDDDDESGRGLLLINAVADRWGYDMHSSGTGPWGKEVWAELRIKDGA